MKAIFSCLPAGPLAFPGHEGCAYFDAPRQRGDLLPIRCERISLAAWHSVRQVVQADARFRRWAAIEAGGEQVPSRSSAAGRCVGSHAISIEG